MQHGDFVGISPSHRRAIAPFGGKAREHTGVEHVNERPSARRRLQPATRPRADPCDRCGAETSAVPTIAILSHRQYLDTMRAANQTSAWIVRLLIGLIGAFAGLAVVNTSVIATAKRRH
jgi:hypothetical protein